MTTIHPAIHEALEHLPQEIFAGIAVSIRKRTSGRAVTIRKGQCQAVVVYTAAERVGYYETSRARSFFDAPTVGVYDYQDHCWVFETQGRRRHRRPASSDDDYLYYEGY